MRDFITKRLMYEARVHRPFESCGLLMARPDQGVSWISNLMNVHPDALNHFRIDDDDLMHAYHRAEGLGYSVVGYWHSHIDTPARPSSYDLERAVPDMISVIVSLLGHGEITAWDGQIPYGGNLLD